MRMRVVLLLMVAALLPIDGPHRAQAATATCTRAAMQQYQRCLAASRGWIERAICDAEFVDAYSRCQADPA